MLSTLPVDSATEFSSLENRVSSLSEQVTALTQIVEDGLMDKTYLAEASTDKHDTQLQLLLSQSKHDMQRSVQAVLAEQAQIQEKQVEESRLSLQQEVRDFMRQQQQEFKELRDEIAKLKEEKANKELTTNDDQDNVKVVMNRIVQELDQMRQIQQTTSLEVIRVEIKSALEKVGHPNASEKDKSMDHEIVHSGQNVDDGEKKEQSVDGILVKEEDKVAEQQTAEDAAMTQEIHKLEDHLKNDYCLNGSIWDASVFIGMPILGLSGSFVLGFVWLVNIFVQSEFCLICWIVFTTEPDFNKQSIWGLKVWRWNSAHDVSNVNFLWPISLASRICDSDSSLPLSGQQAVQLDLVDRYNPEEFVGQLMCLLCLICFWTSLWSDGKDSFKMLRGVLHCRGKRTVLHATQEGLQIESLSLLRTAFVVLTVVLRAGVFAVIGAVGTVWLSSTTSLGDLLLNAVALELVLTVDELLFQGLAPVRAKVLVESCSPLTVWHTNICSGLDLIAMLDMSALLGAIIVVYFSMVSDTAEFVKQADIALCGGATNFVYNVDPLGLIYIHDQMQTPSDPGFTEDDFDQNYRIQALEEVRNGVPREDWKYALYEPDLRELQIKNTKPLILLGEQFNVDCKDMIVEGAPKNRSNPLRAALRHAVNNKSLDLMWCSSSGLQSVCRGLGTQQVTATHLARMLCPVTCGCHLPAGGTLSTKGCPQTCEDQRWHALTLSDTCKDVDWQSNDLWTQWMEEAEAEPLVQNEMVVQWKRHGCEALRDNPDRLTYCAGGLAWSDFKRLTAVCPISCGCRSQSASDCPGACRDLPCPKELCTQSPGYFSEGHLSDSEGNQCLCKKEEGWCQQQECHNHRSDSQDCKDAVGCVWTGIDCECPCNGQYYGNQCACGTNTCRSYGNGHVPEQCFNEKGEEDGNGTVCIPPCGGSPENPKSRVCSCPVNNNCEMDAGCDDMGNCRWPRCSASNMDNLVVCSCGSNICPGKKGGCYNDASEQDATGEHCEPPKDQGCDEGGNCMTQHSQQECSGSPEQPKYQQCSCPANNNCQYDFGCDEGGNCMTQHSQQECSGSPEQPKYQQCSCPANNNCQTDFGCDEGGNCMTQHSQQECSGSPEQPKYQPCSCPANNNCQTDFGCDEGGNCMTQHSQQECSGSPEQPKYQPCACPANNSCQTDFGCDEGGNCMTPQSQQECSGSPEQPKYQPCSCPANNNCQTDFGCDEGGNCVTPHSQQECNGSPEQPKYQTCACPVENNCEMDVGCDDMGNCMMPKCSTSNMDNFITCSCASNICHGKKGGCYNDAAEQDATGEHCEPRCNASNVDDLVMCTCGSKTCWYKRGGCYNDAAEQDDTGEHCEPPCVGSVDEPLARECVCGDFKCVADLGCEGEEYLDCVYPKCDSTNTDLHNCKCGDGTCYYHTGGCYNDDGEPDEDGKNCN